MSPQIRTRARRVLARPLVLGVAGALAVCGGASSASLGAHVVAHPGAGRGALVSSVQRLPDGGSTGAAISADGRYVAFVAVPSEPVPGRGFIRPAVFVRDRKTHVTRKVSVGRQGRAAKGNSYGPSISADGRFVAFTSDAHNLVPNDTNHAPDVFVRDLVRHVTRRVSVGSHGRQGDSSTYDARISADGRHVTFSSSASNLIAHDTNSTCDVFVRDLVPRVTRRVSVSSKGREVNRCSRAPTISAHGRFVEFTSVAKHLVVGDTNASLDVFVRDRARHRTRRVSVSSTGEQGYSMDYGASISADGHYVAMSTFASLDAADQGYNDDVYLRDLRKHVTLRVTASGDASPYSLDGLAVSISAHARYVTFASSATDLVVDDTNQTFDVFVWDRRTQVTDLVSVSTDGVQGDGRSISPSISADGRFVAFDSDATNLAPADTDGTSDVFIRDRIHAVTALVSRGTQAR